MTNLYDNGKNIFPREVAVRDAFSFHLHSSSLHVETAMTSCQILTNINFPRIKCQKSGDKRAKVIVSQVFFLNYKTN